MRTKLFAAVLAIAIAAPALAQQSAPARVQQVQPRVDPRLLESVDAAKPNQALRALPADRAGVRLPAPDRPVVPMPPPLGEAQRRKLAALQAWGLRVPANALKPALMLTPQQPYHANAGQLFVATNTGGQVNYNGTPAMPYGTVDVTASSGWFVSLRGLRYGPRDWLLVECHVANGDTYTVQQSYPAPPREVNARPDRGGGVIEYHLRAPRDGVLSALFPPSSQLQELAAIQVSATGRSGSWQFGGCEVTPVHVP